MNLVLTKNSDNVRVFDAPSGGNEITFNGSDNVFPASTQETDLYVEGAMYSSSMGDVTLTLTADGESGGSGGADTVNFTVVWADAPDVAFSGTVSADNDKIDTYVEWTEANTDALGMQKFNPDEGETDPTWGYGYQSRAYVFPPDFNYPGSNLEIGRYWVASFYAGTSGSVPTESYDEDDTSSPEFQDSTPTDSNPQGWIYDLDAPRMQRYEAGVLEIQRMRANFETYAQLTVPESPDPVRASYITPFFVRMSIRQLDAPTGTNWSPVNDVSNDNVAGYGTTPLTWDLKQP